MAHSLSARCSGAYRQTTWRRCTSALVVRPRQTVRTVHATTLEKRKQAEEEWARKAEAIKQGKERHIWDILEERGFIKDVTGQRQHIKEILRTKRIGAYVGVDPTAPSLHLGHLVAMMPIFWMYLNGYAAVTLIGGATARVGDPTDRLQERPEMPNSEISINITKMHYQMKKIWHNIDDEKERFGYAKDWAMRRHLLNNNHWWQKLPMYEVLKRLGRYMRMGPMLSRDTVKNRMKNDKAGMSVAEFLYPLLQGWDWWQLYNQLNVQLQVGGSDQYGNIVAGIESVKAIRASETQPSQAISDEPENDPFGFTVPLLVDSAGNKFGKSAGNAVWLDVTMTSAYNLYSYLVRRPDNEVEKLLKYFTFLPIPEITALMEEHRRDPPRRVAQHKLATEVVTLVHGTEVAIREKRQHGFMYGKDPDAHAPPSADANPTPLGPNRQVTLNNAPRMDMQLPRSVLSLSPARILVAVGLAESNSEGHRLAMQQGAYVAATPGDGMRSLTPGNLDWTPIKLWQPSQSANFIIDDRVVIFRRGKHNIRIVELVTDDEWKASGMSYQGEAYAGKTRVAVRALQELAEGDGETLTQSQLLELAKEKLAETEEETTVANNPDIRFPTKSERQKVLNNKK